MPLRWDMLCVRVCVCVCVYEKSDTHGCRITKTSTQKLSMHVRSLISSKRQQFKPKMAIYFSSANSPRLLLPLEIYQSFQKGCLRGEQLPQHGAPCTQQAATKPLLCLGSAVASLQAINFNSSKKSCSKQAYACPHAGVGGCLGSPLRLICLVAGGL
mmetsp:Transcript_7360/g.14061  ORF Transcript_7360/g.14061 Transcript_7360/m.14061 type:complete len:157 (+) Transcript_7360:1564-2034(+)